jgi:hypothetical protein
MSCQSALRCSLQYRVKLGEHIVVSLIRAGSPLTGVDDRLCMLAAMSTTTIQALMDRGVVVSDLRCHGHTPLHIAAAKKSASAVSALNKLVDCGVDLETVDSRGLTCICSAVMSNNTDSLRLLVLAGANVNVRGLSGPLLHDALQFIFFKRSYAMMLIAAGADVATPDFRGQTACHHAATTDVFLMYATIAAGADIDAQDVSGNSPRALLSKRRNDRFLHSFQVDPGRVETARREIAKVRLDFVRYRAIEVCIGLQSLRLDALQLCEILVHACGPLARLIAFHEWWKIATTVKHFK